MNMSDLVGQQAPLLEHDVSSSSSLEQVHHAESIMDSTQPNIPMGTTSVQAGASSIVIGANTVSLQLQQNEDLKWPIQYADDILEFYYEWELSRYKLCNFSQPRWFRPSLFTLVKLMSNEYKLSSSTLHLAMYYLDSFMDLNFIETKNVKLVAVTSLLLACKIRDLHTEMPIFSMLNAQMGSPYSWNEYYRYEFHIMEALHFKLHLPTTPTFVDLFNNAFISVDDYKNYVENWHSGVTDRQKFSLYADYAAMYRSCNRLLYELVDSPAIYYCFQNERPSLISLACMAAVRQIKSVLPFRPPYMEQLINHNELQVENFTKTVLYLYEFKIELTRQTLFPTFNMSIEHNSGSDTGLKPQTNPVDQKIVNGSNNNHCSQIEEDGLATNAPNQRNESVTDEFPSSSKDNDILIDEADKADDSATDDMDIESDLFRDCSMTDYLLDIYNDLPGDITDTGANGIWNTTNLNWPFYSNSNENETDGTSATNSLTLVCNESLQNEMNLKRENECKNELKRYQSMDTNENARPFEFRNNNQNIVYTTMGPEPEPETNSYELNMFHGAAQDNNQLTSGSDVEDKIRILDINGDILNKRASDAEGNVRCDDPINMETPSSKNSSKNIIPMEYKNQNKQVNENTQHFKVGIASEFSNGDGVEKKRVDSESDHNGSGNSLLYDPDSIEVETGNMKTERNEPYVTWVSYCDETENDLMVYKDKNTMTSDNETNYVTNDDSSFSCEKHMFTKSIYVEKNGKWTIEERYHKIDVEGGGLAMNNQLLLHNAAEIKKHKTVVESGKTQQTTENESQYMPALYASAIGGAEEGTENDEIDPNCMICTEPVIKLIRWTDVPADNDSGVKGAYDKSDKGIEVNGKCAVGEEVPCCNKMKVDDHDNTTQ